MAVPGVSPLTLPPSTVPSDLHDFKQLSGKTLRKFNQRFAQKMNTIPCIKEELVIQSFDANVQNTRMREKLSTHCVETATSSGSLWTAAPVQKKESSSRGG